MNNNKYVTTQLLFATSILRVVNEHAAEAIRADATAKVEEPQIPASIPVSQRSYDQRLARFRDLLSA